MMSAKARSATPTSKPTVTPEAMSGAGLAAGLAALAGASCCALPLALAIFGIGGAWVANLGILVVYRPFILAGAVVVVGAGWLVSFRRGARPRVHAMLGLATVAVGAAIAVTAYETEITRYLASLWRSR